jgi:two-component system, chemotaxis family, protein-glutamate methylesterase/glutaminase
MASLKVLIVEDSGLVAGIIKETLESDRQISVVGVAANGQEAIELVPQLKPDLITMDVWMPVKDGFATVEWVMANKPTPILVITSSKLKEDVQISLRMLAAGALDVIEKPALTDDNQWRSYRRELISKVKLLATVRVITHVRGKAGNTAPLRAATTATLPSVPKPLESKPPVPVKSSEPKPAPSLIRNGTNPFPVASHYQVVAIASSTGGPTALMRVLNKLPADFPCPILIVQHISEGFTQGLVDWLGREVKLKIRMAQDNDLPTPGTILVAPDRRDMLVLPNRKIATRRDTGNILCPNADALMESIAEVYSAQAIGVVLTGMGNDGAKGLKKMWDAGAYTIAQDEASSLIYGMPRAAALAGGVREILPLEDVTARLLELAKLPLQPDDVIRPLES